MVTHYYLAEIEALPVSKSYRGQDVCYVRAVFKSTASGGPSDVTVRASTEYFAPDALYSGSPEIFPLLAAEPTTRRAVGDHIGIRQDVEISFLARQPFEQYYEGIADLRDRYEFHRVEITIYYGAKPSNGTLSSSSDFVTEQTVEVLQSRWQEDELIFACRDTWADLANQEISTRIPDPTVVSDFSDMEDSWYGEYGAGPVFGEDIIIDAPLYEFDASNNFFRLLGAWKPSVGTFDNDSYTKLFVENPYRDLNQARFFEVNPVTAAALYGVNLTGVGQVGGTYFHLGEDWRSIAFSNSIGGLLSTIQLDMDRVGTVDGSTGNLVIELYRGESLGTSGTIVPTGPVIASVALDPADIPTTKQTRTADLGFPVPLLPNVNYVLVFRWSDATDASNYIAMSVLGSTSDDSYAIDKTTGDVGWALQSGIRPGTSVWSYGLSSVVAGSGGGYRWDRVTVSDRNPVIAKITNDPKPGTNLKYKLQLDGLVDDGSGTFTGTAGLLMRRPVDIAYFLLVNYTDLSTSDFDTTSITATRSKQITENQIFGFAVKKRTFAQELIVEICKQSRTLFYKKNDGKYAFHFWEPSPAAASCDHALEEPVLRDELRVVRVEDEPTNRVFNSFSQDWFEDPINTPESPDYLRRTNSDKFTKNQFINESDSTASDTTREGYCAQSQALYGVRKLTWPLSFHRNATGVQKFQNYLCDRFHLRQQEITVEIPRRYFFDTIDLLDSVVVDSRGIGTEDGGQVHNETRVVGTTTVATAESGDPASISSWNYGTLKGIVTRIESGGSVIRITYTTDRSY